MRPELFAPPLCLHTENCAAATDKITVFVQNLDGAPTGVRKRRGRGKIYRALGQFYSPFTYVSYPNRVRDEVFAARWRRCSELHQMDKMSVRGRGGGGISIGSRRRTFCTPLSRRAAPDRGDARSSRGRVQKESRQRIHLSCILVAEPAEDVYVSQTSLLSPRAGSLMRTT